MFEGIICLIIKQLAERLVFRVAAFTRLNSDIRRHVREARYSVILEISHPSAVNRAFKSTCIQLFCLLLNLQMIDRSQSVK